MPTTTDAWFHTLSASVAALAAAAREYRTAHQSAQAAAWSAEPARLHPEAGETSAPGWEHHRPHAEALRVLKATYDETEIRFKSLYENAALTYAYGAAGALEGVLNGQLPRTVETLHAEGQYVVPTHGLPDLTNSLGTRHGKTELTALRERVIQRERARATVREFSYFEDLADCAYPEMTEASAFAEGLADAAFSYGAAAERALLSVLADNPSSHAKETA